MHKSKMIKKSSSLELITIILSINKYWGVNHIGKFVEFYKKYKK
jgi:hypothetical protein